MWLLVIHVLASAATYIFDDFHGVSTTCSADFDPDFGFACSFQTSVPLCPTRHVYMGYMLTMDDIGSFDWKYQGGTKRVSFISRNGLHTEAFTYVGLSYTPKTVPFDLSTEKAFFVTYENLQSGYIANITIIVETADGSYSCTVPISQTVTIPTNVTAICPLSSMNLNTSSLTSTNQVGFNVSQSNDGFIYFYAFGTLTPLQVSNLTSWQQNELYGIGMLAPGDIISYALTLSNQAGLYATNLTTLIFTCTGLQGINLQWSQAPSGGASAGTFTLTNSVTVSWTVSNIPAGGVVALNWSMQVVNPFTPLPAPDSVSCFASVSSATYGLAVSNTVVTPVMRPLTISMQNKTVATGGTANLDFSIYPPPLGGTLLFQATSSAGAVTWTTATVGQTSFTVSITIANSTAPGVYPVVVTPVPQSGNQNLLLGGSVTFYVPVNQLPITTLSGVNGLSVTPDVTNSSLFSFTTDNRAVNASVRLTPSSPYFIFTPTYAFVVPGTNTSGTMSIHARESAPPGLWSFSVALTGEPYNNNDLSVGSFAVVNAVTVTQDALTSLSITTITVEAGNTGQFAVVAANVRPVNGTIMLSPSGPGLTFNPPFLHFRGTTTAGTFNISASPSAPKGTNPIQVIVTADSGNNNAIPQNVLTFSSGIVTVTQPQITTITQLQSLTNATAGGSAVSMTYVMPKIVLNGSISVTLAGDQLSFSPNPLIITQGNDRGSVFITAQSGALPGLSPVTATLTSLIYNNDVLPASPVTVNGLQVVQYVIDSVSLGSNVVVAAGDDINQQNTYFAIPVPVVNDTITLTPSVLTSAKISFSPSSVTITPGATQSSMFQVVAASDAPAGTPDITVAISQGPNNNNRLLHSSFVISNSLTVTLIPVTAVVVNAESGSTQRNQQGTTTFTLSTLKVVNGPITLTPVAAGITFTPSSLTVAVGQTQTAAFSYVPSSQAVGGARSITVTLSGSTNNNDKSMSPFTVGSLTVLNPVIANVVLTNSLTLVIESQSSSTQFNLGVLASNGSITITPSCPGLTFTPTSVVIPAESAISPSFTINVSSTVDLSQAPLSVALTLMKNGSNNNALNSPYSIRIPATGLPITTVTYTQGATHLYAGFSVPNQYLTIDQQALRDSVALNLSSPFFDFKPSSVNISAGSTTSDLFTMVVRPNAVAGPNQFTVTFSRPSDNNNVVPSNPLIATGLIVEQQSVSNVWVLNPITVTIGAGPSAATRFYLDEPAVNGSIVLTLSHPFLTFTPNPILVLAGSNLSELFSVSAPENMIAASSSVQFFVNMTQGPDNNNAIPNNTPPLSNGILVIKPPFVEIHLHVPLVVHAGEGWSNYTTLIFDVPMLNDSAVFAFITPEDKGIEFSVSSVTVARGSTESSPFQIKIADFVNPMAYPFHINNTGGVHLNNNVSGLSLVSVTGVTADWAAISMGTIPTTTVYAGGNASDSLTITINVAPVYSDINLVLSSNNLIFTPNVVKVIKGEFVSEAFTVTADGTAAAGLRQFQAEAQNVDGENVAHNTLSTLNVDITVGRIEAPTKAPTMSPTMAPTTKTPTKAPTTKTPTKAPTAASPTIAPAKSTVGAGGIAAAVVVPALALACVIIYARRNSRLKNLIPKMLNDHQLPQPRQDPRDAALNGTIQLCEQMLSKGSTLSAQNKLFVQSIVVGAKEDKKALSTLLAHGAEMTSIITNNEGETEIKTFNMEDFEHMKFLSQGEGGAADLYKEKSTGHEVVIKVPHHTEELDAEAKVWSSVGLHPNVARMIGIALLNNRPRGIVMQYYAKGSLDSQDHQFSSQELVRIAIGLARGLQFLHTHKVIHRDLAARNILIAQDRRVAITDFGLSRKLNENDVYEMTTDAKLPWRTLAPEIILMEDGKRRFTEKTDIWALGVTLWELATKRGAYADALAQDPFVVLKQKIGAGTLTLDLKSILMNHENLAPALVGCFNRNPALRPSAEQLRWLLKDDNSAELAAREDYIATVEGNEYA